MHPLLDPIILLLCADDEAQVQQGLALLEALQDDELLRQVSAGLVIDSSQLRLGDGPLRGSLKNRHRERVLLSLARLSGCLEQVTHLSFGEHSRLLDLSALAALSGLKQLSELSFLVCESLESLEGMPEVPRLQTLTAQGCRSLKNLGDVATCASLEHLSIQYCLRISWR